MSKIVRTHDAFYLNENRYEDPKELFVTIGRLIAGLKDHKVIADVGCAAGEFAFYLRKIFPDDTITGYDILPELILKAQNKVPDVIFKVGSILDSALIAENSCDVLTCTGVIPIFDSFEPVLSNLLRWARPGGRIYVHGLFNPYPVDVIVKYNKSEDYGKGILEAGWNIFSKESISSWLAGRSDVSDVIWHDFRISIDLKKQEDIIRSWTIKDENKDRIITNGLSFIQPHAVLEIEKR